VTILKFVQKLDIENKKLRVQLFPFKREKKDFTSI
jgi:hypothetical protein